MMLHRCAGDEATDSRWGCPSKEYPLNIIVTDETQSRDLSGGKVFKRGTWDVVLHAFR